MSYYQQNIKFHVSNHARARIKQRLNIKADDILTIDLEINKRLDGILPTIQTAIHDYYKIPNTKDLYAIVLRESNLIMSVTPIGPHKMMTLL